MKQIAFLTDIHLNEQFPINNNVNSKNNFETVLADLADKKINEIIFGGDIGHYSSHHYFFDQLKNYSLNLILGNHDQYKKIKKHFVIDEKNDELFYAFEDENYKYIFLDTSTDEISGHQIEWLKLELNTNKKIILFVHHPIIKIDTPIDSLYPLKNRGLLRKVLEVSGKCTTVFCGHYHMNDEQNHKNIKQITTHSLSYQIIKNANTIKIDNSTFGYRIIKVFEDNIETQLVTFKA